VRSACEPLVLPAAFFAAGILAESVLHPEKLVLVAAFAALLIFWILCGFRFPRLVWPSALSVMLVAGALTASSHARPPDPELDAHAGETLLLSGCIESPVAADGIQSRFVLELEPGARARVTLTTRPDEKLPGLQYGDRVEVQAKVRKPRNFGNPGAFDYVGYLRRDSVFWLASARGTGTLHKLPGVCGSPARRAALGIRDVISSRLALLYRNDEYAARLMPALLVGDNAGISRSWTEDFRRTGTYHALVISGLHIAVVSGAALVLMRALAIPLGPMLGMAAALAWTYAAVADWQSPVVRSALGFSFFLFARWFFRRGRILNLLGATAILLLLFDPTAIFDPGFQLTFLSVAAIGALSIPLSERTFGPYWDSLRDLADPKRDLYFEPREAQFRIEMRLLAETFELATRVPKRVSIPVLSAGFRFFFWTLEMASVSACVQIALLVPMVAYFHQVSVTGILANITVVPALSAAVPVGLVAALVNSTVLAAIASSLLGFARITTVFWASIEPAIRVPDVPLPLSLGLLAAATLGGIALLMRARARWVIASGVLTAGLAFLVTIDPFGPNLPARSLELTAIDVGQGDSLLIVFPDNRTMLVDGGGFPVFDHRLASRLDIGEDVVSPYLWRRGLHRLDFVVVSHLHDDHAAGLPAIIRNFRPSEVWTGAAPAESSLLRAIQSAAHDIGASVRSLREGEHREHAGASLTVLAPSAGYMPGKSARNDDSLVLLLAYGRHKFLLTGDAERKVESDLAGRGVLPEIDVLKAGHHGSRTSTTPEFLSATRPLFALISVGEGNSYGHPFPEVLDRLGAMGTRVLRTDQSGLVQIRSDGKRLTISRYSDDEAAVQPAVFDTSF
jgi:competence protein ComEC